MSKKETFKKKNIFTDPAGIYDGHIVREITLKETVGGKVTVLEEIPKTNGRLTELFQTKAVGTYYDSQTISFLRITVPEIR